MGPSAATTRDDVLRAARESLWRRGELRWKMHPTQAEIYDSIQACKAPRFTVKCSRRLGKSWLLTLLALETTLRTPGCRVVYGAPTAKALIEFIIPAFEALSADAPPECRGKYNSTKAHWDMPNGSHVAFFGADDKAAADRGRGPGAALAIADEAGFFPVGLLTYVLRDIFKPQLLHSGGKTLIASTPSPLPEHEFGQIATRAEAAGNFVRKTIFDNTLLSKAQIDAFILDDAKEEGMTVAEYLETDTFKREYLAIDAVDKLLLVIPEWTTHAEACTREVPRPEYFDAMTVLDFGGADPHAAIFGYWDFKRALWVLEDELLLKNGENTQQLAKAVRAKEVALWGSTSAATGALRIGLDDPARLSDMLPDWLLGILEKEAPEQPYARWCDNDIQLARDLYELHKLAFIPTAKDELELQVNNLRVLVAAEQLAVNPRCVHTVRHLRTTTWENHKRRTFARVAGEHGDLVATLVYGCRNLDRQRNPEPAYLSRPKTLAEAWRQHAEADANQPSIFTATALGRKLGGRR